MRLIWGDGGETCALENNWASVELEAGCNWATCLKVDHLDGAADDGFHVYVNGYLVGTYVDFYPTNTWVTTEFDISSGHYSGLLTIRFEATGVAWPSIGTFGQVAFNEIKLYGLPSYPVTIDIKPGSDPNSINLGSKGVIPVAILSSANFDATQVDPSTVTLAGAGVAVRGKGNKSLSHEEDVNGDGLLDLVVQVETENLDPNTFQDGVVCLTGSTFGGLPIKGCDAIVIVPPE
jgi:hypothetical protein